MTKQLIKVAAVQATPVLFNLEATVEKVIALIREAAKNEVDLMVFPEAFIPAYPRGLSFGTVVGSRSDAGRELWLRYWQNSMTTDGNHAKRIGQATKAAGVFLSIGITEKEAYSGTLYCTNLYFAPSGELIGKHRKLKPTGTERIIWGEGDGSTLTVLDTEIGKIGGLICWENYMPLARMAMYQKGIEIYLAPTADQRDSWQSTLQHIALEGRCFVIGCNQFVTKQNYPSDLHAALAPFPDLMCRGGSVIISPLGETLAGPLFNETGILYASVDRNDIPKSKLDFDPIGHYNRPDVFQFTVVE